MSDEEKPGLSVAIVGTGRGNAELIDALAGGTGAHFPKFDLAADITTPPTLRSTHGRAWSIPITGQETKRIERGYDRSPSHATWLIEAAYAHPFWHSYWIQLVDLRPFHINGVSQPTKFYLSGATHEMWLHALDAESPRQAFIEGGPPHFLTPKNFGAQWIAKSDADAKAEIERAVQEIIDGVLSPDTDFQSEWIKRFGDAMLKLEFREPKGNA